MKDAWKLYEDYFSAATDDEIEAVAKFARMQMDETRAFLNAVLWWKIAGKPRTENTQ